MVQFESAASVRKSQDIILNRGGYSTLCYVVVVLGGRRLVRTGGVRSRANSLSDCNWCGSSVSCLVYNFSSDV